MRCPLLKLTMNKWDSLQVLYVHQCSLLLNWFSKVWNILLPAFNICLYFSFFGCSWKPPGSSSRMKVLSLLFGVFLQLEDEIVLIATITKEGLIPYSSSRICRSMNEFTELNTSSNEKLSINISAYSQKTKLNPTLRLQFRRFSSMNYMHWIREWKW